MSAEDVATKAPESDAQEAVEASPFKGDSIAQEGPSMGVRSIYQVGDKARAYKVLGALYYR
jgi:hypothetical protein